MENETREQAALTLRRGGKWRGYGLSRHQRRGRWKITRPDGGLYAQDYDLHSPTCGLSAAIERLLDEYFPPVPEVVVPPPKKKKAKGAAATIKEAAAQMPAEGQAVPPEWIDMAREAYEKKDSPPLIDPATGEEVVIFHDLQDGGDLL